MAQWLRVLAALTEDWGSVPNTHTYKWLTTVSGDLVPSSSLCGLLHICGTHTNKHAYTHIFTN